MRDHTIVCGYGTKGESAVSTLLGKGTKAEADRRHRRERRRAADRATAEGLAAVAGNASSQEVLGEAGIASRALGDRRRRPRRQRDPDHADRARAQPDGDDRRRGARGGERPPAAPERRQRRDHLLGRRRAPARPLQRDAAGDRGARGPAHASARASTSPSARSAPTRRARCPAALRDGVVLGVVRDGELLRFGDPRAAELRAGDRLIELRRAPEHGSEARSDRPMSVERISRFGFVNSYLVEEPEGLTVIDTMLAAVGARGSSPPPRRRAGRSSASCSPTPTATTSARSTSCAAALPDADVIISARDARMLKATRASTPASRRTSCAAATRRPRRSPTARSGPATGSARWRRSPPPATRPGQLAFLDPRDGTLYCADVYSTLGGVATSAKVNPRFPLPALATWHRPTALESARALRALDPKRLAPGHGKVVEDPERRWTGRSRRRPAEGRLRPRRRQRAGRRLAQPAQVLGLVGALGRLRADQLDHRLEPGLPGRTAVGSRRR